MNDSDRIVKEIRAALEQERRIDLHHHTLEVGFLNGDLIVAGEVETVAAKKLALEYSAALAGETRIVDRLLVKPGEVMEDADLGVLIFDALGGESAFGDTALRTTARGGDKKYRAPPRGSGRAINVTVGGGVVTLEGKVESYAHKALAGVLAWWRRGTRNVVNNLDVEHILDDPDGEMTDAVRMVLEKDRLLNSARIRASCRDFTVILDGAVKNETEKELAERDAWYLFGVIDVENRLRVVG